MSSARLWPLSLSPELPLTLRVAGKVRKELVCGGDYSTFFFYRKLIRLLSGARQQRVAMWFLCVGVVLKVF